MVMSEKSTASIFSKFLFLTLFLACAATSMETSASSVLGNKGRYSHENIIDGNFQTAWVEGDSGDGAGEWVMLDFGHERLLTYLGVINGYAKFAEKKRENDLWHSNNRVFVATLAFSDGTEKDVAFRDARLMQYLRINKKTSFVKLTIKSIYKGTDYKDACISEIVPVFDKQMKFDDSTHQRVEDDSTHTDIFYDYHYYVGPLEVELTRGVSGYFGRLEGVPQRASDSVYYFGQFEIAYDDKSRFTIASSNLDIEGIHRRIEYRYVFEHSNYCVWLGADKKSRYFPNYKTELSYYGPWEKMNLKEGAWSIFERDPEPISFTIDSIEIAVYPDRQKEKDAARDYLESNPFSIKPFKIEKEVEKWEKTKKVKIRSSQILINYRQEKMRNNVYLILPVSCGT